MTLPIRSAWMLLFSFLCCPLLIHAQTTLPSEAQALLNKARAANPARYQFAVDKGAQILPTNDGRSFYVLWYPSNLQTTRPLLVSLHGSSSWAFDEFFLWQQMAEKHGVGILALQWWFGVNEGPNDYYGPEAMNTLLTSALQTQKIKPGNAMLHGFSRGGANSYGVVFYDRQVKNNYFGFAFANAGGESPDYPLYADITSGKYGSKVFVGTRWGTFCGGLDPNPDRDGCPAMQRTASWVKSYGASVDHVIEDPAKGHGGFHQTPAYIDAALTTFDKILAENNQPSKVWSVKPDANFRINNASIPNVGWVKNEVWLTAGTQQGLRLYRSADGSNAANGEALNSLATALSGSGYAPTETVPREASDGSAELYVLGLGPPNSNRSVLFRLREQSAGVFALSPSTTVFAGGADDNQFIGVPDVYKTNDGKLRLVYVGRGSPRSNARTAVSSDGGQTFTFESNNPFGDLTAPSGPGTTNVDPAVVKLASGGYLAVAMRLKKLYLFASGDGVNFTPLNLSPLDASQLFPGTIGFFDPTLVQLPSGKIWMYATAELSSTTSAVVRAELIPASALKSVSAASYDSSIALARESIVSGFGENLAPTTQSASDVPLPTTLAGTTVTVRDNLGTERLAPLFFVSPNQINYQIPPDTATGVATIIIRNNGEVLAGEEASIVNVAPAVFAATADGKGYAAANTQRNKANGAVVYEDVTRFDPVQNKVVPVPIDLSMEGDEVFLVLYGTGLRFHGGLATITAQIGGLDAPVIYADRHNSYVGVDQVNIRLPVSLKGRGEVNVELAVQGQTANAVRIFIR